MDFALWSLVIGWAFVLVWVPATLYSQRKIHPKALFVLFFAELWERFSFYGMRALLVLFLTKDLFEKMAAGEADAKAYGIYGAYNALLYAAPVIGGMLADRAIGFRKAILTGGAFMALGQFILALSSGSTGALHSESVFFLGLAALTVGNGLFKPNISSFLGTFYDRNDTRKDGAYTLFYMGINIGAFLAPLTCGYLGQRVGWHYGFFSAGLGMLLGMVVFFLNFKHLDGKGHAPENGENWSFMGLKAFPLTLLGCLAVIPIFSFLIASEGITDYLLFAAGGACLIYLLYTAFTAEDRAEGQRLFVFLILFFFHMIFWVLFEQAGGSINILTDRYVDRAGIEASQFQSVNALFIMLLAPVFNWLWVWLAKNKLEPRTPMKFFYGLLQMAIGYGIIVWGVKVGIANGAGATAIPMAFLIGMYLLHTTGELFLSPVGLSVVTKLSPQKVVGFVMGSWFLSIAFAHKVAGKLGQLIASAKTEVSDPVTELTGYMDVYLQWGVFIVLGCAAVLLLLTPTMKRWMHGIN